MKKYLLIIALLFSSLLFSQSPVELKPIIEIIASEPETGFGQFSKGVGDINKDGYNDVVVSASQTRLSYLYYGGNPMDTIAAKTFKGGGRITSGDFNGDGWIDLAIEKYFRDTVYIYYSGADIDTIPDLILHAENFVPGFIEGFGFGLKAGDLNNDGIDDLVISALGYTNGSSNDSTYQKGKVYLYKGTSIGLDSIPIFTITGDSTRVRLGSDLALGDINNNGEKDIITLGRDVRLGGSNEFYYIKVFLNQGDFNFQEAYYIDSRNTAGGFRDHIESFDADGDGIDDILVNRIYIFKGGTNFSTTPTYYVPPPYNDTTRWGRWPKVGGGGDYNGDGLKDVLLSTTPGYIGSPGVTVYLGRAGKEPQFRALRIFPQSFSGELFFPGNAGDVNGDGVDDIVMGGNHGILPSYGIFCIYSGDTNIVTGIKLNETGLPNEFELLQNYPNPFNPETIIRYEIPERSKVELRVYDILGKEVVTLVNEFKEAGRYEALFNADRLSSGVYFYTLRATPTGGQAGTFISNKKMILVK